jgi:PPM family protein phosphatase
MRGKMDCHGLTDIGKVRESNEDQFLIADLTKSLLIHQTSLSHEDHTRLFGPSQGQLLLVADGMGGAPGGQQASAIAVQGLAHYVLGTSTWFLRLRPDREDDLEGELKSALEECQKYVEAASEVGPERMGTTLTMAYVLWPRLYVVHAGDSRCYLLRGQRLEQITTDHTVAQQLVEKGALDPGQAQESRWSHVLWNCIGGGSHALNPDVYKATLQLGDTLLLCTDGLSKPVPADTIRQLLLHSTSAEQACRQLVEAANERGGPDNVTVVIARFLDSREQSVRSAEQTAEARAGNGLTETAPAPALADPVPAGPPSPLSAGEGGRG